MEGVERLVDRLFRRRAGEMVASLTRILGPGRIDLAEDVVQDALIAALRTWPLAGVPREPVAWLVRTAHNRAIDRLRRERRGRDVEAALGAWARDAEARDPEAPVDALEGDTLGLMFACCTPALAPEARVALTLKVVCGFSVAEIARAFLAREDAVAQRIVRAKRVLRESTGELAVPPADQLSPRLDSVLDALYLVFNEGIASRAGSSPLRVELVDEALRLIALACRHAECARPESHALHALMLFQSARLGQRLDASGELLLLDEQDRSRWDRARIAAGFRALRRASRGERLTAYHVEAALASCHCGARSFEETDWPRILALYDDLLALRTSPVAALNRCVALSRVAGPTAALAELDALPGREALARYSLYFAVRGELLRRSGRPAEAAVEFARAIELPCSEPERRFLAQRARECSD